MIQIPGTLSDEIKSVIKENCLEGEQGWSHGEYEEDTIVGDFLGNLRTGKTISTANKNIYEWEIVYKKFHGRGINPLEKETGADGIITFEISDQTRNIKTVKPIIFQAKKKGNYNDLKEQTSKMNQIAKNGNFVLRLTPDGYFAKQDDNKQKRIGDFLVDDFLACKTGIEGMTFDPIRKQLKFETLDLIHFEISQRLSIKVDKLQDFR